MYTEDENLILSCCDDIFPEVIDFTKEMVKQYSVLNQEQGVLDVVEEHLVALNLPVERVPIDLHRIGEHPLFAPTEWSYDNKYNLVSKQNVDEKGSSLVLNGHLDVVSAYPYDMWSKKPDIPWEKDGWLYGRGAGDMQSGVAAMIYAVHAVQKSGFKINSPISIQAVIEEECTGNGALACIEREQKSDFVLIPEPFGPQIYIGQLGVLWFKLLIKGRPVHVLDTSSGINAIELMQLCIPYLKELEAELNEKYRLPPYDQYDHPYNLNIGKFKGGNWASSVPAFAEMEGRISFPVGMSSNQIMQLLSDKIETAISQRPELAANKPELRFHGFRSEGHMVEMNNPGISLLSDCHKSLTQREPEHYLSTCTTDLRAFHFYNKTAGTCYGPIAKNIHGVDECVDIESIRHTLKAYALFISRWCELSKA